MVHIWKSEANFQKSVFSFYRVGPRDGTQVLMIGLYLPTHTVGPESELLKGRLVFHRQLRKGYQAWSLCVGCWCDVLLHFIQSFVGSSEPNFVTAILIKLMICPCSKMGTYQEGKQ